MEQARPLVRLPLQVGTTATWSAARVALALAPGLALLALGAPALVSVVRDRAPLELPLALIICGAGLAWYASHNLSQALRTRANDLLVFSAGLRVEGGPLHGTDLAWTELTAPWASVEETKEKRLSIVRIPLTALGVIGGEGIDPHREVPVWRLWATRRDGRTLLAEADRPSESASLAAAAATIAAVAEGRRHVENAPQLRPEFAACQACAAPLVPEDAHDVTCRYCGKVVPLPERVRQQAAAAKAMRGARARTVAIVQALLEQPGAHASNLWLAVLLVVMLAAWPVGWWLVARRIAGGGFQWLDAVFLAAPLAGVLGGFLFARGRLADRGAMQLLTLGFGALAPARPGEPACCRRCLGPLPEQGPGGVAACVYCGAENIVGVDLRPALDRARTEAQTFDATLTARRRERLLWTGASAVALLVLCLWAAATVSYLRAPRAQAAPTRPAADAEPGGIEAW